MARALVSYLVFSALYLGLRLPLLTQPLVGEEGVFAQLVRERPSHPNFLWIGRLQGADLYTAPEHPRALYEPLRFAGAILRLAPESWAAPKRVAMIRLSVAGFQLCFWLALLTMAQRLKGGRWSPLPSVILLSSAPLAVLTSIELQIDGSVGVFLCGFAALFLCGAESAASLFAAGLLSGLGKQEWGVALLGAALGTLVCFRARADTRRQLGWIVSGILAGHAFNAAIDWHNYVGGWNVAGRVGKVSVVAVAASLASWIDVLALRLPVIVSVLVLLGLGGLALRGRWTPALAAAAMFSGCLFLGFALSTWEPRSVRYFSPAFAVAAVVAVRGSVEQRLPWLRLASSVLALQALWLVRAALMHGTALTLALGAPLEPQRVLPANGACVPAANPADAFGHDRDFVSFALDPTLRRMLADEHRAQLCER